ncbi:MAG: hypothetical protein JWN50_167 [Parcubacteria group bacterium]|nr:hypothetical protein [Parcubacteria group bacterium]
MHDLKWWLAPLSGAIAIVGYLYLAVEWKQGWNPARASWFSWIFILGGIATAMIAGGSGNTAILPACYCVGTTFIWILSLKRGVGGWTKTDCTCMGLVLASMIGWILTGSPVVSVFLNILADLAAGGPTFLKLWKDPRSESRIGWSIFALAAACDILAARTPSFTEAGYPVFAALFCIVIVLLTYRRRTQ